MTKQSKIAVQCRYESITKDGFLFRELNVLNGQNSLEGWHLFKDKYESKGAVVGTLDQFRDDEIDVLICIDRPEHCERTSRILMRDDVIKIFILLESPPIVQSGWDLEYHKLYNYVLTWSDDLVDGIHYIKSNFTTMALLRNDFESLCAKYDERKLVCMINSCVVPDGERMGINELYSLRIQFINYMLSLGGERFDLYGNNWPEGLFSSYCGRSDNKFKTFEKYKFAFCVENFSGYNGYVSEKMLDALVSGCIPIYLGAPNINELIPKECYVDLRDFSDLGKLIEYLESMTADEYALKLNAIEKFWSNPRNLYSSEKFIDNLSVIIDWNLYSKSGVKIGRFSNFVSQENSKYFKLWQHKTSGDFSLLPKSGVEPLPFAEPRDVNNKSNVNEDEIVLLIGWDPEYPLYRDCKRVWDTVLDRHSWLNTIFVSDNTLARGAITLLNNRLSIGCGNDSQMFQKNYYDKGIWSASENEISVYRLVESWRFVLNKFPKVRFIWGSTITSILHPSALLHVSALVKDSELYAGYPGTLQTGPLAGIGIIHGATLLISADVARLIIERYDEGHTESYYPNDHWLGLMLQDLRRTPLPLFSFETEASPQNLDRYHEITKKLIARGHFRFRVKTRKGDDQHKRDKLDARVLSRISEAILDTDFTEIMAREIIEEMHLVATGDAERLLPLYDSEIKY